MDSDLCTTMDKGHIRSIDFSHEQAKKILGNDNILSNLFWDKIPNYAVITGKNGAGKTKILEYIEKVLKENHKEITILHGDFDNSENVIELPKFDEVDEINVKNAIYKYIDGGFKSPKCLNGVKMNKELKKEIINKASLLKEKSKTECDNELELLVDSFVPNYYKDKHNLKNPVETLTFLFKVFDNNFQNLEKKYRDMKYLYVFLKFLANSDTKSIEEQLKKLYNDESRSITIKDYIKEVLRQKPPWEKLNELYEKELSLQLIWNNSGDISLKKIAFRHKDRNNIDLSFKDLSSGEKLVINLFARVFYFQICNGHTNPKEDIKKVNVMLLDEPDCHLDPQLCKLLHNIISNYFVEKCDIQVIMSTHRLDTVKLAPENSVFVMEHDSLTCNKGSAIRTMANCTNYNALLALSNGRLSVNIDCRTFVYVENVIDRLFYFTMYERFKSKPDLLPNYPKLVFLPVGINAIEPETLEQLWRASGKLKTQIKELESCFQKSYLQENESKKETDETVDNNKESTIVKNTELNEQIETMHTDDSDESNRDRTIKMNPIEKLNNTAKTIELIIKNLKSKNDTGGGVDQLKKKSSAYTMEAINDDNGNIHHFNETPVSISNTCFLADGDGWNGIKSSKKNFFRIPLYSIECYLCLPINLLFMLKNNYEGKIPFRKKKNNTRTNNSRISKEEYEEISKLCTNLCNLCKDKSEQSKLVDVFKESTKLIVSILLGKKLSATEAAKKQIQSTGKNSKNVVPIENLLESFFKSLETDCNTSIIKLANGMEISYPSIFIQGLEYRKSNKGHDLFEAIRFLVFKNPSSSDMKCFVEGLREIPPDLLAEDLLKTFIKITSFDADSLKK